MRRAVALPLLCLGLLGAGPIRCGDDPMPRLEAEQAELLARTVPKAAFWTAVERKGQLVKQEKEVLAEVGPIEEKRATLGAEISSAQSDLEAARAARKQAEATLEQARSELARARAEQEAREARLRGFAERHAAEGSP
jgi:chromosome segregation ATPase